MSAVCCTLPSSLAMPALGFSGRSLDNGVMHGVSQYEASLYCNMGSVPVADLPECGMRSAGAQMRMMPAKDCWQSSTTGGCVTTHADCSSSISASTTYHSTRKVSSSSQSWIMQQQQQHQQAVAACSATTGKFVVPNAPRAFRRAPVSSAGRVSHRMAANLHTSTAPVRRALCIDPNKDYSTALHVDCSIEYDLPRVARPPPGAQPLLLIAKPSRPSLTPSATYHRPRQPLRHDLMLRTVTNLYDNAASAKSSSSSSTPHQQHEITPSWWSSYGSINNPPSEMTPTNPTRFKLSTMDQLPLATCSSADSGRGTDSERSPGTSSYSIKQQPLPWSHIPAPVDSGLGLDPCFNYAGKQLRSFEPVHQSAFDNFRTGVFGDMRKFFDDLRTNIASGEKTEPFYYEDMPDETLDKLVEQRIGDDISTGYQPVQANGDGGRDRHRSRLRGFVSQVEPLRRKSQYDPALLWTGLGR